MADDRLTFLRFYNFFSCPKITGKRQFLIQLAFRRTMREFKSFVTAAVRVVYCEYTQPVDCVDVRIGRDIGYCESSIKYTRSAYGKSIVNWKKKMYPKETKFDFHTIAYMNSYYHRGVEKNDRRTYVRPQTHLLNTRTYYYCITVVITCIYIFVLKIAEDNLTSSPFFSDIFFLFALVKTFTKNNGTVGSADAERNAPAYTRCYIHRSTVL